VIHGISPLQQMGWICINQHQIQLKHMGLEVLDDRKQNVLGQIVVKFIPPSSELIVKKMEE
jgi:hypothetical protein